MSWTMRTFLTASLDDARDDVDAALPGFRLGERLTRLDRLRPSVEWWTLLVRGGMLDEVVRVSTVQVHPGTRVLLRSPEWTFRWLRALTARCGGFGGALVHDAARYRYGRALVFAGRVVDAASRDVAGLRLDLGRPAGVDDPAWLGTLDPAPNHSAWVDLLQRITGLTTFDLDQALVRRPPRRHLYALEPDGVVSDGWESTVRTPRTVVAMFVDPETYDRLDVPAGWGAALRLTPPRLDIDTFKQTSMSYAVLQHDGPADLDVLDRVMRGAVCDATAVQLGADGAPVRWWDWEKGAPAHTGEVLGSGDFVEVWGPLAVALDTNPHVFSAPWPASPR